MKAAYVKSLLGLALGIVISPFSVAANTGIIHFRGQIVEDGCQWEAVNSKVAITCSVKGKWVTRNIALNALNALTLRNDSTIQATVRYLDPQRRLAILTATYQ